MTVQISPLGLEGPVLSGVRARLQRDAWLYYAVLGYTVLGMLFLLAAGDLRGSSHAVYIMPAVKGFLIFMPLVALGFDASRVVIRVDKRRRLAFSRVLTPERFASLAAGILLMAGLTVFQGTFTTIKTALPQLWGGFPYDRVQADIDAMLFFGTDPWRVFHAVGGNWVVRTIVEFNYNVVWFAACYGVLFFVATSPLAVVRSVPPLPESASSPGPPTNTSSPPPPIMTSFPASPYITSSPVPPSRVSAPSPPHSVSLSPSPFGEIPL